MSFDPETFVLALATALHLAPELIVISDIANHPSSRAGGHPSSSAGGSIQSLCVDIIAGGKESLHAHALDAFFEASSDKRREFCDAMLISNGEPELKTEVLFGDDEAQTLISCLEVCAEELSYARKVSDSCLCGEDNVTLRLDECQEVEDAQGKVLQLAAESQELKSTLEQCSDAAQVSMLWLLAHLLSR